MPLPRILILYTGGTFGMDVREDREKSLSYLAIPDLSPTSLKKRLFVQVPELQDLAQCNVDILMNRDSSHIGPDEWISFAHKIKKEWKKYDGVVLLHGTDTLSYTASALSFLLRPHLKPVVITGAQRPLSALRTDARANLISAVEIAAYGPRKIVNQVSVFFGDTLFQGSRVRKKSASDFSAFESPNYSPLAVIGTTTRYSESKIFLPPKNPNFRFEFSRKVLMVHITPGFPASGITFGMLDHLEGLVLVTYHSGTAPTHDPCFIEFLEAAKTRKIPIVLVTEASSQPPNSTRHAIQYAAGQELRSKGCFWAGSMTPECAYVKTSLLLAQTLDLSKFAELWDCD